MNSIAEFRKKGDATQDKLSSIINELLSMSKTKGEKVNAVVGGAVWTAQRLSHYETGRRTPNLGDSRLIVKGLNCLGVKCSLDDVFPPESRAA